MSEAPPLSQLFSWAVTSEVDAVVVVVVVVFIRLINLKQIAFIMKNKEACTKSKAHGYQIITQIHK